MQSTLDYITGLKKHIILGVAFEWGKRKGLDVFIHLAKILDSQKYQIVLIGTDDAVDKELPDNIVSVHRTQNQEELARYYSYADVFVIPTREDNYPTVNLEAIACGTPVITFATGGSVEMIDCGTGVIVPTDDIKQLVQEIIAVCNEQKCSNREYIVGCAKKFDMREKFREYIKLYSQLIEG